MTPHIGLFLKGFQKHSVVLGKLAIPSERMKLHLLLTSDTKLNSECTIYLNVTAKTVKLL
jgi:hypothetical protein